jgi:hypothetical protein
MAGNTGRLTPPDWEHVEKYPLSALAPNEIPKAVPIAIGIPWYSSFDHPKKHSDGSYWIESASGGIRGGHEICLASDAMGDLVAWWEFYNQGNTGECVGFAVSRMMTLLNRARYDAPWLYFNAQDVAGQPRDPQAGTYGRAAAEVLRIQGHKTPAKSTPGMANGIAAYRWAQSIDEMNSVLASPNQVKRGAFNILNSWGRNGYPHVVRMPFEIADSVIFQQDGDAMVVTDR